MGINEHLEEIPKKYYWDNVTFFVIMWNSQ